MWAGFNSGFNGHRGQRTAPPPQLFPHQPPSTSQLGISETNEEDASSWPLHAKDLPPLPNLQQLKQQVKDPLLREACKKALSFLESDTAYGITHPPLVPEQLPRATYSVQQVLKMLQVRKITPLEEGEPIRSGVRGFPVRQAAKRRWRPIFEPLFNHTVKKSFLPPLRYPSRLERRNKIASARYCLHTI